MRITYEKIMDVIIVERHYELMCAEKCRWLMKRTVNPIRKLRYYLNAKRFMDHVFGMDLIIRKIEKIAKES